MTLTQAITIFTAFDKWCRQDGVQGTFVEYTREQVLEAQAIILATAKHHHSMYSTP